MYHMTFGLILVLPQTPFSTHRFKHSDHYLNKKKQNINRDTKTHNQCEVMILAPLSDMMVAVAERHICIGISHVDLPENFTYDFNFEHRH